MLKSLLVTLWVLVSSCQASEDARSSLQSIFTEYYQWRLQDSPQLATYLGQHDRDDRVDRVGLAEFDVMKTKADEFLSKLSGIDASSLHHSIQYSMSVLNQTLTTVSEGYRWRLYGALNPVSFLNGPQINPGFLLQITKFETKKNFEDFISKLNGLSKQMFDTLSLMTEAVKLGRTNNIYSMNKVPGQFEKIIKSDPSDFIYYKPFKTDLDKLSISDTEKQDLRSRAGQAAERLNNSYKVMKNFIDTTYMLRTRGTFGVGGLNMGGLYYIQCLRWHLTTDLDPDRVHQTGLSEVSRIKLKMEAIMRKQNFNGTISEYFAMLRKNPKFYFKTGDEIIARYKDIIYNRFYPALPKYFKNIPKEKVKVGRMANDGPPAQYQPGTTDGSREGEFQANVFRPKETDGFAMAGYAMHESVPGHHLQFTYKHNSNLPKFMKEDLSGNFFAAPFSYPGYSAYVEGWALYAESLGEELGLYIDDYELMGRYGNEMFRATRLVVDTGLHFMGWSRTRAITYMKQYNSLSGGNLENEIDRYITWPGQACAYKIGELKIRGLRQKAEAALGSRFDIRDFHEVVLQNGAVPLDLLERIINDWIAENHGSNSGSQSLTNTGAHTTKQPTYTFTGNLPMLPNIG